MSKISMKTYNPTTASLRGTISVVRNNIWKGDPHKALTVPLKKTGGRNNYGRITCRHIGGGHKQRYRVVDFKRNKVLDHKALVERIEYDPNRNCYIALIKYVHDGSYAYILAPQGLESGAQVYSAENEVEIRVGNCAKLRYIPVGAKIHNIELKIGAGGKMVRAGGGYAEIMDKNNNYAMIKLPSGKIRLVHLDCRATLGELTGENSNLIKLGKAGRSRHLGIRPTVRGVAMNPVDHPHGGGEGKTSGGRHPVTPWGKPTKGKKTRANKRTDRFVLSSKKASKRSK